MGGGHLVLLELSADPAPGQDLPKSFSHRLLAGAGQLMEERKNHAPVHGVQLLHLDEPEVAWTPVMR